VLDAAVMRGLCAHRVGLGRIAGEQVGLTAATAVIDMALVAAAARLAHPAVAAKCVERVAVVPDLLQRALAHVRQREPRQRTRGMTRQRGAVRCDAEEHRAPPVHARLRPLLEVVGHDEQDLATLADELPVAVHRLLRIAQLLGGRHQLVAIEHRPAVVLRVREFEKIRAEVERHFDDAVDVRQVVAMQHAVQHHRIAVRLDQARDAALQLERPRTGQEVVQLARRILQRQLDMVEPGRLQPLDARGGQADARRNEVRVEAERACVLDQRFEIVALQRLAAGKTELRGAERARVGDHGAPRVGVEFRAVRREVDRVVAERAMQRAAVGEFGE